MKAIPIYLCLVALLISACASNAAPRMTASQTTLETATRTPSPVPTATPAPTVTPTPTETPTTTPTPTPDIPAIIQGLVVEFGLNPGREYQIVTTDAGEYLVDTFNQAKMLRSEGSGWVETDWAERYGHLLPEEPRMPYIGSGRLIWDLMYSNDQRFLNRQISPISTGNSKEVVVFDNYQGREITMAFLETVFRYNGEVVPLYVFLGSDDIPGTHRLGLEFRNSDGTEGRNTMFMAQTTDEIIDRLPPGTQVKVIFQYQRPQVSIPNVPCSEETGYCIDDYAAMVGLFWRQADMLAEFNRRITAGEEITDLAEELLIPTSFIDLYIFQGEVPKWVSEFLSED